MKRVKFECDDKYEAEKLAGLLSEQTDSSTYLAGIVTVVRNEIVIKLKDKSSHAVMLKNENTATRLREILEEIVDGKTSILSRTLEGNDVQINLSD